MNDVISVLIVDDNIEFGDLLEKYIERESGIKVAGVARDGLQAIEMITALTPDVVILDLIMPNLDGIGVLEKLSVVKLTPKPLFIMLSAIGQDIFIKKAILLGAEYYFVKPFDVSILMSRIKQLFTERHLIDQQKDMYFSNTAHDIKSVDLRPRVEYEVTNLMRDIGVSPHLTGYHYLREAIIFTIMNSKTLNSVTKVLYPEVAIKFNTSAQRVERAIRSAIESAWSKNNIETTNSLLGYVLRDGKSKPTNSEFIAVMADKIRVTLNNR